MRIVFDADFDSGAWPGPLRAANASIGEKWTGPKGFLTILETGLGLGGLYPSSIERALGLVEALEANQGFWSNSVKVDPIGSAKRILTLRDELWMCGWRGQGNTKRLRELAAAVREVKPGLPDRLKAIAKALEKHPAGIDRLELYEDPRWLPAAWRAVIEGLERQGTRIALRDLQPADARGDLAAARQAGFSPAGDGSLQLVRPPGCLEAAEQVAAWLSALGDLSKTVLIGADAVLDQALHRYGLPTSGMESGGNRSALLAVMPLVMMLGWNPADPQRAYELLSLPVGPVPEFVARRLADALCRWPAVGGDYFRRKLKECLETIEDRAYRELLAQRIAVIFSPGVPREARYPLTEVEKRLTSLERWLRGRYESETHAKESWKAAIDQCVSMRKLVRSFGRGSLSRMDLELLIEHAGQAAAPHRPWPAQAGLAAVQKPGCVAGRADHLVWWNFSLELASQPAQIPLSAGEGSELRALGVELPDQGSEAVREAARWRRPFEQAAKTVVLVCPQKSAAGEDNFPHPAWYEIKARLAAWHMESELVAASPRGRDMPAKVRRRIIALPRPVAEYKVGRGLVKPRLRESPSSIGPLLGCPLKYVLEYSAGLSAGFPAAMPEADDGRSRGNLSHRLIEQVLELVRRGHKLGPAEARAKAEEFFEREAPGLMAVLFLPGNDAARAQVRLAVCRAAARLVELLTAMGLKVKEIEKRHEDRALGTTVTGKLDLLVGDPDKVIDFKWAGAKRRILELEAGTSMQLATYSRLVRPKGEKTFPPVACFIIRENRLLATDEKAFPAAETFAGSDPAVCWAALAKAYAATIGLLADGVVRAAIEYKKPPAKDPGSIADGRLVLPPQCGFCEFECLCKAGGGG